MIRPTSETSVRVETSPGAGFSAEAAIEVGARSRRSFLGKTLAAAAVPAALAAGSSSSHASSRSLASQLPSFYPNATARNFGEIRADENSHVAILEYAIYSLGGTPRPRPSFTGLNFTSVKNFLNLSITFENTGVGAYQGAAGYVSNINVLAVAASIAFTEAYHSGFLNSLGNLPLLPSGTTYTVALSQAEVVNRLTPFLVSLNGGPTPGYSTSVKSIENDIAILNFALVAEFLEQEFYNLNVPRIFPGY